MKEPQPQPGNPTAKINRNEDLIELSNKNLDQLPKEISSRTSAHRLNLSMNQFTRTDQLSLLKSLPQLTWIQLSNNQLEDLNFLKWLPQLSVVNVGGNRLKELSMDVVSCMPRLKALILNNNQLERLCPLSGCKELNTLVLSYNQLTDVAEALQGLEKLTKISLGHNRLTRFPIMDKKSLLKELRLGDNRISAIPSDLHQHLPSLEILDLGNNAIQLNPPSLDALDPLTLLPQLHQLTLRGNPSSVAKPKSDPSKDDGGNGYEEERVREMISSLRILDGKRFDEKYLNKKRRKTDREHERKYRGDQQRRPFDRTGNREKHLDDDDERRIGKRQRRDEKDAAMNNDVIRAPIEKVKTIKPSVEKKEQKDTQKGFKKSMNKDKKSQQQRSKPTWTVTDVQE